jgi:hypothetical protein
LCIFALVLIAIFFPVSVDFCVVAELFNFPTTVGENVIVVLVCKEVGDADAENVAFGRIKVCKNMDISEQRPVFLSRTSKVKV